MIAIVYGTYLQFFIMIEIVFKIFLPINLYLRWSTIPIPPHKQKAYREYCFDKYDHHYTEVLSRQLVSLPIGPHLSDDEVEYVTELINSSL